MTSNAKNMPSLRLSLGGTYRKIVEVEPNIIRLVPPKERDTGEIVIIKTDKKNFKVTGVTFHLDGKDLDWQADVPLNFSLTPTEPPGKRFNSGRQKQDAEGVDTAAVYKLRLFYSAIEKSDRYGEIIMQTNIPEKPELKISGVLEGKKQ